MLEFRRALVPSLSVGVTLTLILTVIEKTLVIGRGENPATAWGAVQMVILGGIAISGLFVGARVFSEEFKRVHHPLLAVLPLPAGAGWYVLSIAGLSSSILAITAVALLRPALIADREALTFLGVALLGHAYLYLIGACLALTLRRSLFVPLLGYPLAAFVVFETLAVDSDSPLARTLLASFGAVASMLFFALAGWRIYVRGEFDLQKTRVMHLALILGGAMLLVFGVRVAYPTPLLIQRWRDFPFARASAGARYVALNRAGVTGRRTIYFASVDRGGPTGRWTALSLGGSAWARDEDVLWAATVDEPLLRLMTLFSPPSAVLATIGTDGTERSRVRLPGSEVFAFEPLPGRRALALVGDYANSKIVVVGPDGAVRVLEESGMAGAGRVNRASDGRLVVTLGLGRLARGFLFDGAGLQRLETIPLSGETPSELTVVGRRLFVGSTQALAEIERRYPRPPGSPDGHYIYDHVVCDEATTVFYVTPATSSTAKLEVWDPSSLGWKDVGETSIHPRVGNSWQDEAESFRYPMAETSAFNFGMGVAVYVALFEGRFEVSVFDAKLGRSIPLARLEQSPLFVSTTAAGGHAIMVTFPNGNRNMSSVFTYVPGSGAAEELPPVPTRGQSWPTATRPDGTMVILGSYQASWCDRDGVDHLIRFD
jgi:hypothetical protein